MAKAPSKTQTFPNTAAGREQAIQQARRQGEPSITFKLKPATPASNSTKRK